MLVPAPSPQAADVSLALPRSFWKDFARDHFDRKPTVLRQLFPQDFPSSQEIFEALVNAAQQLLREQSLALMRNMRFYLEHDDGPDGVCYHSLLFPLTRRHLPLPEDGSPDAYVERLDRWLNGKRFGIVLNRAQSYHWRHWQQMRSFLQGLYAGLGVPLYGADPAILFGNYRFTPFGIHKDDLHVFNFVVHGKKVISLWPFETLSSREEMPKDPTLRERTASVHLRDKADEDAMLAQASFIEGDPGDILCWPASYWHRAEPTPGLSVCVSLGVAYRPPEFAGMEPPPAWPGRLRLNELPRDGKWRLPDSVQAGLAKRGRGASVEASQRELTSEWVRYLTGGTMSGPPPEETDTTLTAKDWVRGNTEHPLVAVPLPGDHLLVSGCGRSTSLRPSPAVRRRIEWLVSTLNSGKPQQVEALETLFFSRLPTRGFNRKAFQTLLQDLVRWRSVRRVTPVKR
ncbi:hypothetical protein ACLESD_35780 [Pyxidicoccus sp. 3LFB2]